MWRVDWEEEAAEARKHSIAMQAERLLQGSPCDVTDVENSLNGASQGSHLAGGESGIGPICKSLLGAGQGRAGLGRAGQRSIVHVEHSSLHVFPGNVASYCSCLPLAL